MTEQTMTKSAMLEALRRFINQRSGIEYQNYNCPILRHGRHAREMLRFVELHSISEAELLEASKAYSGRLQFKQNGNLVNVEYTTGQYFPTEYRNAACAVLASAIWHYWQSDCKTCDEIRAKARTEFGRAIASTWFN